MEKDCVVGNFYTISLKISNKS